MVMRSTRRILGLVKYAGPLVQRRPAGMTGRDPADSRNPALDHRRPAEISWRGSRSQALMIHSKAQALGGVMRFGPRSL